MARGRTPPGTVTGTGSPTPDEALLVDVARRYYLDDASKVDIARDLGLSRFKVARLLEEARARGIVRISVSAAGPVDHGASGELADRLRIERCVVVDTSPDELETRHRVATAAARLLPTLLAPDERLGLTWSRAVDAMVGELVTLPRCTVVQLAGALAVQPGEPTTVDLVQRAAGLAGGVAHAIHAPLIVDDVAAAASLRRQVAIRHTLRLADDLDVSVVAVGAWRAGGSTVWDAVPHAMRRAASRAGAVAEVSGHLLDEDGRPVDSPLEDLVIAATLRQLTRPARRMALVSGSGRAVAVEAAVRAGLVNVLVTTTDTARSLLGQGRGPGS